MRGRAGWLAVAVLLATLLPPAPGAAHSGPIRVALVEGARTVELKGADIQVIEVDGCADCVRAGWRAGVVRIAANGAGVEVNGRRASAVRLASPAPIRLDGRLYAGRLEVTRSAAGLLVVNELPLEEYLVGVLLAETGDQWPPEALRAQAIAARTFAAYQRALNAGKPYHILASTAHQQFAGRVAPSSPAWGAVRETEGQVLLLDGRLFPAFYHTDSGGYTEDPRRVFLSPDMPALPGVRCEYSVGAPHYQWQLDLPLPRLAALLRAAGLDVGSIESVEVTERTPSLRAAEVLIHGQRGRARLRGPDLRRLIGPDTLKSTLFAVALDGEVARFSGRGYGHGVGLSQWGARGMAEQGHRAEAILEYYYPGTTLGHLDRLGR